MAGWPDKWEWWGDEGGKMLRVELVGNRAVRFTVMGGEQEESVTLANFRTPQLRDWLSARTPHPPETAVFDKAIETLSSREGEG